MKATKAQRAIDKRAMEQVGAKPLADEDILVYLRRIQKASLQWMTECAENMTSKGTGASIMLYDKSTAELDARLRPGRQTGAVINLVFKQAEKEEEEERDEEAPAQEEPS